jgi:predicted CoA-binding protein
VIIVPPAETEKVVREADAAGIQHVWMQQGAESDEAIQYCQEHGLKEVHGECIMMFAPPVNSVHRWHRGAWKLFGKLPK